MISSIIVGQEKKSNKKVFPTLMIREHDKLIVLFKNETSGTVVHVGENPDQKVGTPIIYYTKKEVDEFKDFDGIVQLKNA